MTLYGYTDTNLGQDVMGPFAAFPADGETDIAKVTGLPQDDLAFAEPTFLALPILTTSYSKTMRQ